MSINTLPYNPTILNEIENAIPSTSSSSLAKYYSSQQISQSNFQIGLANVNISATSGKQYLVQVSFSVASSVQTNLSLVFNDGISTLLSIIIPVNNWHQVITYTFNYTAIQSGNIQLDLSANVAAPDTITTTTSDFVNIVVYTL